MGVVIVINGFVHFFRKIPMARKLGATMNETEWVVIHFGPVDRQLI